jgi:hypothetical protein
MKKQLKVKYSSLNDNSIAFDGHLFPKEQPAESAWKRGVIGNSQERKTAPISF